MQGEEGSGASTPADGTQTPDLDLSESKKKKKKKDLPLDLGEDSGTSTPVAKDGAAAAEDDGAAEPAEDLDFGELRKKKKSKKKAALDLEAFERELGEAQGEDGEGVQGADINESELGGNVFASADSEANEAQASAEPWLGSDRDYNYPEVSLTIFQSTVSH